jgi:hypothetical protein
MGVAAMRESIDTEPRACRPLTEPHLRLLCEPEKTLAAQDAGGDDDAMREWRRWAGSIRGGLVALVAVAVSIGVVTPAAAFSGWSIAPSPNRGAGTNVLTGVSCASLESCQAVGYSFNANLGVYQTLIEARHGPRWSIVGSPNRGTGDNEFLGTSCATARSCTAVGFSKANDTYQTLVESWNGRSWSLVPSPNYGTFNNILDGVSCVSAVSCQAVGYYYDTNTPVQTALTESWNGRRWSIVGSADNGTEANILYGVSCLSARSCQAVGYYENAGLGAIQTLIESWNGVSWSIIPSPDNGTHDNYLLSVSCTTSRSCKAVGQYGDASAGTNRSLTESWNGSTWSVVASPNVGTGVNDLLGVSCRRRGTCEAVGLYFDTSVGSFQTLVESWNGVRWSVVTAPDRTTTYNALVAVSCGPFSRSCAAVGDYNATGSTYLTLVESNR